MEGITKKDILYAMFFFIAGYLTATTFIVC